MDWFKLTYSFLGGLGIFFFGMNYLSETLQQIAGTFIRRVIRSLTTNRIMAVMVGAFVTTLVQSSSVTTVMTVGLVNAGLMQLTQAIGVIFGANIGTTITGWIIAIKVGKYGLLFIGLGIFPLLFVKNARFKALGGMLVALGFIFMGLEFMSGAFKPLRSHPEFLNVMQYFDANSIGSVLACVGVGTILTFIIQSSSAMLGITIALALTGAISFQTAVALVLGENIGTTITALLASVTANTEAKRAARAHAFFNVLGVCVLVPFFWHYVGLVDYLIGGDPDLIGVDGRKTYIAVHIATAHSLFNVTNVILFLPFIKYVARLVVWATPAPKRKEVHHLRYITTDLGSSIPLALSAAEKEIESMADLVHRTLVLTRDCVLSKLPERRLREKVMRHENITDSIQTEITTFLCKAQEAKMTFEQSSLSYALIRAADELESMTDYCASMLRYRDRLDKSEETFSEDAKKDLKNYFEEVIAFNKSIKGRISSDEPWNLNKIHTRNDLLTEEANKIRDRHKARLEKRKGASVMAGLLYSDMVVALRKFKGHAVNVAESLAKAGA